MAPMSGTPTLLTDDAVERFPTLACLLMGLLLALGLLGYGLGLILTLPYCTGAECVGGGWLSGWKAGFSASMASDLLSISFSLEERRARFFILEIKP